MTISVQPMFSAGPSMGQRFLLLSGTMPRLPHPFAVKLGARIKELRMTQTPYVTQTWLAREIGCTVQQMQKYESAETRIPSCRLKEIADALGIKLSELVSP